jgi:hypothetical protein
MGQVDGNEDGERGAGRGGKGIGGMAQRDRALSVYVLKIYRSYAQRWKWEGKEKGRQSEMESERGEKDLTL